MAQITARRQKMINLRNERLQIVLDTIEGGGSEKPSWNQRRILGDKGYSGEVIVNLNREQATELVKMNCPSMQANSPACKAIAESTGKPCGSFAKMDGYCDAHYRQLNGLPTMQQQSRTRDDDWAHRRAQTAIGDE